MPQKLSGTRGFTPLDYLRWSDRVDQVCMDERTKSGQRPLPTALPMTFGDRRLRPDRGPTAPLGREPGEWPMYEMRAGPATTGSSGLVWHVLVKNDARTTLCGRRLSPKATPPGPACEEETEETTERYCLSCMTAFQETMSTAAR